MSDKLKNCPHCGNNDYVIAKHVEGEDVSPDNYQVVCNWLLGGCGASGGARRTQAEAIATWNQRADEFGADDDYERRMDELLCRLTNGKWSKSRRYSVDFMVSCVDEAYEKLYEKECATLGRRTCTVTHDFNCSNCGKQIDVVRNCEMYETCDGRQAWKSLDHEVCDVPNYCPNCGAKVVKP